MIAGVLSGGERGAHHRYWLVPVLRAPLPVCRTPSLPRVSPPSQYGPGVVYISPACLPSPGRGSERLLSASASLLRVLKASWRVGTTPTYGVSETDYHKLIFAFDILSKKREKREEGRGPDAVFASDPKRCGTPPVERLERGLPLPSEDPALAFPQNILPLGSM